MANIVQISILYNTVPRIIVDYDNVITANGKTKDEIQLFELGKYIALATQQAAIIGNSINWTKGGYEYNGKVFPAIIMASQQFADPPITNYKSKVLTIRNKSAKRVGFILERGIFLTDDGAKTNIDIAAGDSLVNVKIAWMPDPLFDPSALIPNFWIFDAGLGYATDPLNNAGAVPFAVSLTQNGFVQNTQSGVPSGTLMSMGGWNDINAPWNELWITDVIPGGFQFVVKVAATAPAACAGVDTVAYCADIFPATGSTLYSDAAMTVPLVGNFVLLGDGFVYPMVAGVIGVVTATVCIGQFTQFSNTTSGGIRTQVGQVSANVIPGNIYGCVVYSHAVEYTAQIGDTPLSIVNNLIALVNATTPTQWNDNNSAPPVGTAGFPPTATLQDNDKISLRLNTANQFAFYVRV